MNDFWQKLNKPIMALAPMYDVTDSAFRFIIAKYGKPDVMWTEFVSADGLCSELGRPKLISHLDFDKSEHPIVAQLFGKYPEKMAEASALAASLKFDGIDINMGCPDKNMIKQGSCAALYNNPALAQEMILSAKQGAPDLPVSVKIRIGDSAINWRPWIRQLLVAKPAAITIHLRTRKEMSKVPAHWELMPEIVQFIHNASGSDRPIIIGNGDVATTAEAEQKVMDSGCDGVMIGRGIFGNPWLFNKTTNGKRPGLPEVLQVMLEHTELYEQTFSGKKPFEIMKKHYKAYLSGFPETTELKNNLYEATTAEEVRKLVAEFIKKIPA